jgi:hypothetical protein
LNAVDFLSTIAQVSVAIAGFSGIVVAIGHRAAGALTAIERLRLVGLLAESFFILALVVTAMMVIAVALLQVYNIVSLREFWPFAVALAFHLALALILFAGFFLVYAAVPPNHTRCGIGRSRDLHTQICRLPGARLMLAVGRPREVRA